MSNRCYFQNNHVVCSKHKSEVCGVCCSDYALFNELKHMRNKERNIIDKAITTYFKKPKNISRAGANRTKSPECELLLKALSSDQTPNYIEIVTSCGFACFTARFSAPCRSRIATILQLALDPPMSALDVLRQRHADRAMDIKNRKKKRKQKMKQKQIKKQKELKKKGIRSKQKKYNHASWRSKVRNGEIDLTQNIRAMLLILAENGCSEFGSFFDELEECSNTFNEANNELFLLMKDLGLEEKDDDCPLDLNDSQKNTVKKSRIFMDFMLKYGAEAPRAIVPFDDPQSWNTQQIKDYLKQNNIIPKPDPSNDVLIKITKQLISMKSKMLIILQNIPKADELKRAGNEILYGRHNHMETFHFSDDTDSDNEIKLVVDAQDSIPINVNPFILKHWITSTAVCFEASVLCSSLTTKCFKDMQETFVVIARCVDQYESINQIPMFVVQDNEQIHAIFIIVMCVKECQGLPMIIVKYYEGKKATASVKTIQRMMHEVEKGKLMLPIGADLIEVQLMSLLLKKNRNKLLSDVVKETEKQFGKGWRLTCFLPYHSATIEKKCPTCNQLASFRCSRCKKVSYCSRKCQKIDWKSHTKVCNKAELQTC